jgi:GNAT superfamily N-acetyltransferase
VLHLRRMTAADVSFGMHLGRQAGWNQTAADWLRFLAMEPDGCFVAEQDGTAVGTTATCIFGPVAWVALVLVEPQVRGRGIGTALVSQALAYLDDAGIPSVRLDATSLGLPLYEKLGFRAEYELARFAGIPAAARPAAELSPVTHEHLGQLAEIDRATTGADRSKMLTCLFMEYSDLMRLAQRDGIVEGYLAARPGAQAWQVGPCVANATAGPRLLNDAWRRFAGQRILLDVPSAHTAATALAGSMGLTIQRRLVRMGRGVKVAERVETLWASSGPEKG